VPTHSFILNRRTVTVDAPDDMPLLWVLRDLLGVTGPKYGCGVAVCGSCMCLLDGKTAIKTCSFPVSDAVGHEVTTIEGLADGDQLHPVQEAWIEQDVVQCGYCQPGQIIATVALLQKTKHPTDEQIDAIDNVCRCGTYFRIRQAIKLAATKMP
jgi:isoquinoline 1-oxidoreductase alpha subunit